MRPVAAVVVTLLFASAPLKAGSSDDRDKEKRNVLTVVTRFLKRLGDRRFDTVVRDLVPSAVIMATSQTDDGQASTSVTTALEWLQVLRRDQTPTLFQPPITNLEIIVDGRRAYLRADFQQVRNGTAVSRDVARFTLVRDGVWRISMLVYTSSVKLP